MRKLNEIFILPVLVNLKDLLAVLLMITFPKSQTYEAMLMFLSLKVERAPDAAIAPLL